MALSRYCEHTIDLVIGRLPAKNTDEMVLCRAGRGGRKPDELKQAAADEIFSQKGICPACALDFKALIRASSPSTAKLGACQAL